MADEGDFQVSRSTNAIKNASVKAQKMTDSLKKSVFRETPAKMAKGEVEVDEKLEEIANIIRTYRGVDLDTGSPDEVVRWFDSPQFDIGICAVVLLNIFIIGLEMDLGNDNKQGYDRNPVWIVLQWLFCLIFLAEIAIKVYYHTWRWFQMDPWSWLALAVATLAFVDTVILMPLKESGNLRMFSLIRCIVLFRLVKVIQNTKLMKELQLVLRGTVGATVILAWALGLIVFFLFIFSVWTTTLIGHNIDYADLGKLLHDWDSEEYFGTIGRSMYTLVQMFTLDTWASNILRPVTTQQWYFIFFFVPFTMVTTYGIMNVILSVIIEQTVSAARSNENRVRAREDMAHEAVMDVLREIYLLADVEVSEALTLKDFKKAAEEDGEVIWRLRQLDLLPDEVNRLFQVIDGDGARSLNMKEFVEGCTKLKGVARSKDLLSLQHQADAMAKQMDALGKQLRYSERMLSLLDDCSKRMTIRFQPSVESSRRQLAERDRGRAPTQEMPPVKHGGAQGLNLGATNQPRLPNLPNLIPPETLPGRIIPGMI